ncbi:multicopper oxidase domain-containing protein [Clostridium sp.]|uniref:multicopper oxidase domain-containing protein n=1 Tax=Clostridium sp. TaxID=1506 RepID=UPI002617E40A|nr:multicopper oxidase domain-containing protein [Clostridium sp.]
MHFKVTNGPETHMHHSHVNVARQDMLGLLGGFVILDPNEENNCQYANKDYLLLMQEWSLKDLKKGDNVRIRFGTIQINHHPMHLHGHKFWVEKADGNPIDPNNRILKN